MRKWYLDNCFKMAAKILVFISQKKSRDQNLKTAFPKEFFNKISFNIREHEYIYIAEIKIWEKNIPFKNGSQKVYCHTKKCYLMLINVKNGATNSILSIKRWVLIFRQLLKRGWKIFTHFNVQETLKRIVGIKSCGPPYALKCWWQRLIEITKTEVLE